MDAVCKPNSHSLHVDTRGPCLTFAGQSNPALHPETCHGSAMADFRDDLDLDIEKAETQASDLREGRRRVSLDENSSNSDTLDQEIARHPTHASRRETQNLQHLHTVGSTRHSTSEAPPLRFGGGKPFPPLIQEAREAYVVDFDGPDDPLHPFNWRLRDKYFCR